MFQFKFLHILSSNYKKLSSKKNYKKSRMYYVSMLIQKENNDLLTA